MSGRNHIHVRGNPDLIGMYSIRGRRKTMREWPDDYRVMCTIAIDVASRCWVWPGGISRQGYGRVKVRGRDYKAHRFSWETFKGPIPDNLTIDHLCKNKACVNPDHLEPVTSRENILRSDGASAVNARKTHCNAGHPFSGDNLYILRGNRICRECGRVSARNYQRRKRGAAKCK